MRNPLKQFCKWRFEQGDRKWQQNELEHGFEQWWDFFWVKTKWMVAGISEGAPQARGRAQGGRPRPLGLWFSGGPPSVDSFASTFYIFQNNSP